jgi:hypothetical protein
MPESAPSEAWVRCPLCRAEYQLQEAIAFVPPALALIERPAGGAAEGSGLMAAVSTADEMGGEAAGGVASAAEVADASEGDSIKFDDSLLLDEPAEVDLDSADTSGSGAMIGSSKGVSAGETVATGAGSEDFFDNLMSDEAQAASTAGDTDEFEAAAIDEDEFQLAPREEVPAFTAAGDSAEAATAVVTAPRRKERKSHPLVMLAGVLGGGLTGIVLGYAILMWAFGKDPAGVAKSLPDFLVPSSLKRTTIAQGNQPAPGGDGTTFPAFGSGDGGNAEDAMPESADEDASKAGDSDPFGVAGKDAERSETTEPQTTSVDPGKEETKTDEGKSDPFGAVIDDPLMKKESDPFGAVDGSLTKKADGSEARKQPIAVDPLDNLTAPSEPTKSLINDPFADPPAATKSDATKEVETSDEGKTEPAKSDERQKEESTPVEATRDQRDGNQSTAPQQTTSRYPTEVGIVGPQVQARATEEELDRALEAAKETTAAAMAIASDAPQADKNRVNGPHFVNLTKVADAITTLDVRPTPEAPAEVSTDRARRAVETAVLEAVPDQTKFDELGKLSGYFFNSKAAKAGIVIAGTLKESKQTGEVFESVVETPVNNVSVTVVSPMKLAEESEKQVVVLGRLVEDPESIRGYEGSAKRTVWSVFAVEPRAGAGQ